jgi:hypothetical protein
VGIGHAARQIKFAIRDATPIATNLERSTAILDCDALQPFKKRLAYAFTARQLSNHQFLNLADCAGVV